MKDELLKEIDKCFDDITLCDEVLKVRQRVLSFIKDNIAEIGPDYFKLKSKEPDDIEIMWWDTIIPM